MEASLDNTNEYGCVLIQTLFTKTTSKLNMACAIYSSPVPGTITFLKDPNY